MSQQDSSFLTRGTFLGLLDDILSLGDLLLAGSTFLGALDSVFELLKCVCNALAKGWENSFGLFDCSFLAGKSCQLMLLSCRDSNASKMKALQALCFGDICAAGAKYYAG